MSDIFLVSAVCAFLALVLPILFAIVYFRKRAKSFEIDWFKPKHEYEIHVNREQPGYTANMPTLPIGEYIGGLYAIDKDGVSRYIVEYQGYYYLVNRCDVTVMT